MSVRGSGVHRSGPVLISSIMTAIDVCDCFRNNSRKDYAQTWTICQDSADDNALAYVLARDIHNRIPTLLTSKIKLWF